MDDVVRRRSIRLAMIYPWWFGGIPDHWLAIAHLHLSGRRVAPADDKVTFYATDPNAAEELREKLDRFAPTLPPGVRLTFPCPRFRGPEANHMHAADRIVVTREPKGDGC